MSVPSEVFQRLSLAVLERGWLSSNNVLFTGGADGAAIVDTGYASHSDQTVALVAAQLDAEPLARVFNTHLHSDHCGGNAALHQQWRCSISVPSGNFAAAAQWREEQLTFKSTGQRCDAFPVHAALQPGTSIVLGQRDWEVHSAPGHDPNAIMLFRPEERVLISGDALWQHGVAILFPEFQGGEGFAGAARALDTMVRLAPRVVVPGHGPAFTEVDAAIRQSRERLKTYERHPEKHRDYSGRALLMFRMLEHRSCDRSHLVSWAAATKAFHQIAQSEQVPIHWLHSLVDRLISTGALTQSGQTVHLP